MCPYKKRLEPLFLFIFENFIVLFMMQWTIARYDLDIFYLHVLFTVKVLVPTSRYRAMQKEANHVSGRVHAEKQRTTRFLQRRLRPRRGHRSKKSPHFYREALIPPIKTERPDRRTTPVLHIN
jgi:hypothetical protein